ncbi:MAG: DUF3179 domain-containing protein [Gemmatimonadetes bacterium]|nr:DUF3179 domain-containing protein [Gemmatimonadota bacterium]
MPERRRSTLLRFVVESAPRILLLAVVVGALARDVPAAQADGGWRTDFSRHTVPLDEIVSGGPPKDGIPAIDRPRFVSVGDADRWLAGREPVVVLELGGEVKAYPLQILIWHEIVNDVVGGVPVTVTYCPLCNTALAFDRRLDDQVLDFGTTGRLRRSDLVMYDRQTESWWQQATGEGIVGSYAGRKLEFISAPVVNWNRFKQSYPGGRVLSRETGFERPYGRNPYAGYDDPKGSPIAAFFRGRLDDRLPAMERVVGVEVGGQSVAYPFAALMTKRVVNDVVGGRAIAVFWVPGTASAVDARAIAQGRDVGSSGVFERLPDGRTLTFAPAGDNRFRDRETGSEWDVFGRAVTGPLAGRRLQPLPHGNHFWFAWAAFRPDTRVER